MTDRTRPAVIAVPAQEDGGATILEIGQQPEVWREVAGGWDARADGFLRDLTARSDLRVILTGAGSSAFAGEVVAPALRRHLGRRVEAIATTSIVASPLDHLEPDTPTLLVSFARSGNSPESVATTELADEIVREVWHLVLTCDRDGQLARTHADRHDSVVLLMPERTNDTGFAMTSSLTSMMLSCLLLLGGLSRQDVEALSRAVEHIIEMQSDIRDRARTRNSTFVYLGAGGLEGLARESALKLLELTAGEVSTYFDSPLGFRHGPKAVLDSETLVLVFVSTDAHTRRYDLDIIAELRAQLGSDSVTVISAEPLDDAVVLPGLADLNDSSVALAYLVYAQYLALFTSIERGKTPDNPFPSGEVNRVVEGVTIHPMYDTVRR
ncbi:MULTISPECIES: SIS domain-containing protein [unclassified Rhodococcus (in: high G+C Gram-positive bacteria)]|uniref:SIS domain-containing protein n=1 Tax=unclassified Rhodococcus (in: high G+C Gram-positive bacteria) TaxID=192944 RepID=UPI0006FD333D|nr:MULTISPECIES: SIS domain-containing protein [unclassified Rhodococcus (in: high G+C Gram-positive bacteria)]KQU38399.1 tagatose-6-phosphate ketose isomerase [Rhodococcus sp. Leaf225]KQU39762.1 tagatose-6-phosphate ketose isomerase [Rhodococcus sp. Leaf258]